MAGNGFQLSAQDRRRPGGAHREQLRSASGQRSEEQFDWEAGFRLSLSIMNRLMEESLLTPKEYGQIERILARKFSPIWAGLPDIIKDKSA